MLWTGIQIKSLLTARSTLLAVAAVGSVAVLVLARVDPPAQAAASAASPPGASTLEPVTIRFGVIEPPVVAQRDITVREPASPSRPTPLPLEVSGLAWIGDRLMLTSDRHTHVVFQCRVNLDHMLIGDPEPIQVIRAEQFLLDDAESITVLPPRPGQTLWTAYVLCSQSNDLEARALPHRRHLLSFRFDPAQQRPTPIDATVVNGSVIRDQIGEHLNHLRVPLYRVWNADVSQNTYRWGNVEGMTFIPPEARPAASADDAAPPMLVGLRNPQINDDAVFAVLQPTAITPALQADLVDLFTLDLGGRGVADLAWDPVTRGYLIAAALSNGPKLSEDQPYPLNSLDAALFWWSGRKSEPPVLFAKVPDMKIEAICRLGDTPYIAIASDEGDISEGREQRQSMLTIVHFTGVELAP